MLEPIEDGDLDLKNKFLKGDVGPEKVAMPSLPKTDAEIAPSPEAPERRGSAMEKDDAYAKILAKVKSPVTAAQSDVSADAKMAGEGTDYENKIIKLVELAETKGIVHAVKVAQHLEDNYLLDELHDRLLATDLHDALVKKGMITEE
ncbi:MAG: hypothetical protein WCO05_04655 [Candidatus Moraniibacteriota bacterium]